MYPLFKPFAIVAEGAGVLEGKPMTRHSLKTMDCEGFLRAFTDEWRDLQVQHKVDLQLTVRPSDRRGVLLHTLKAWSADLPLADFPKASVRVEFPSASVQSYEAFMFSLTTKLARVLELRERYPEGKG